MDLPPFVTILDGKAMDQFWGYIKWFLFLVAPVVMIWVAIELVGWLAGVIRGTVEDDDKPRRRHEEDDEYY